ncbi:unnamed protein product [Caenorhabditis sp. 36 PRJEB53466]|nr:unnamed protein product [Caenorhabditis sp. 36 PRJEB53466]
MPNYKLTYFNFRGIGEVPRQLFHLSGTPFEDDRLDGPDYIYPGQKFEVWDEMKPKTPFGRVPILSVDGFEIPESAAICRYLARKFGYAGKTPEEAAWADAIVDQFKDFGVAFRPTIVAQRAGKPAEEIQKLREETYIPARDNYFRNLNRILEKSKSGFLVGDGLTWADLVLADSLYTLGNMKELDESNKEHLKLKKFQERIYGLPELKDYIAKRPASVF